MSDTDTPGDVLRRFGFTRDGKHIGAPSAPVRSATPAPTALEERSLAPGSVLGRFGFDAGGEPINAAPEKPSESDKKKSFVEKRARQLAEAGGGFGSSVVAGMPIIGPLAQRGAAAANAAIAPAIEAVNPNAPRGADLPFSERYAGELEAERRADELYRIQHPALSIAGNLGGAGALTGPVAATRLGGRALGVIGETLGARAYQGAAGGATIGGADAALRGENPVSSGGAPLGALFGAAGPVLGAGAGRLWEVGRNAYRSAQGALANLNPVAREWIANAFANETPQSITAARQRMGPQGFVADLNPSATELAAGMASRAEPPASANIAEAYRTRQDAARQVTEDALNRTVGPRLNIEHFRDQITQERARVADPLYERFRATQVEPTERLEEMIPALDRLGLLREAEDHALMRGIPFTNPMIPHTGASGYPTTESWDMVKRAIDARIERAYAGGADTRAADLVTLKNRLINEIRQTPAGPVWDQARTAFAEQSELLNQIEAGRDTFLGPRSGASPDQLREELRGLSLPELQARLVGVRQAADETMGATRNGDTTLRNKLLASHNQEKLRLLLGDDRAEDLIRTVNQQAYLADQAQFVNPRAGSATAGRTGAAKALEAPPLGHWDFNLLKPGTYLPPSLAHEFTLSGMLQGGRNATYAAARQQLAPILTGRGRDVDNILTAIGMENATRRQIAQEAGAMRRGVTLAITGPASEAARLETERKHGLLGGLLSAPAY